MLIPAASSSVGLAAIQIARSVGARPVALTRSSAKRGRLLDEGAEAVVVTDEEDVVTRVNELTNGHGARVVFDPVGGPALADLIGAAAPGGTVIVYGALSSEATTVPVMGLGGRAADLLGRRRVFLTAVAVFTLTSLVGGLPWSPECCCSSTSSSKRGRPLGERGRDDGQCRG